MVLADRGDGGFRHAELSCTAGLRAPDIQYVILATDSHRREHAHAHIKRAFKTDIRTKVSDSTRDVRRVQEHRERSMHCPPAGNDGIKDSVVLRRYLVLAGDGFESGHGFLPKGCRHWQSKASDPPPEQALPAAPARGVQCWCLPPWKHT